MGNVLAPILGGVGALGQMNAARNSQQQAGQYNQILANQAQQQMGMFQNTLPMYQQALDFFSRRAGFGGHRPDNSLFQQQPTQQFDATQQWKPLEIGGPKYHGLSDRLRGKGDPTNAIRGGVGQEHSIANQTQAPQVQQPQDPEPPRFEYTRQFGSNKGAKYTRTVDTRLLTGQGDVNGVNQQMLNRRAAQNPNYTVVTPGGVSNAQMGIWNNP